MPAVRAARALMIAAVIGAGASPVDAARSPALRDAEHYALASCLTAQREPYMRDQGFGLGAIVANRVGGSVDRFAGVRAAVLAELKRRPMTTIHGDGPVGSEKPMPVAHCLDLLDAPVVAAAIARASGRRARR